ncbi:hypothetical protein CY34DRAFT_808201 [Suillus luteus UH-Slu-Lm8-n1]|uniref:Uncharacterized protein n=1 Tax=Suillus luteus UH-Slu-Lm8-n1 TaxID=930992 RepID=A0A0D0B6S0_9AGAM|nr:hypothetical protein CY34DRAFT_808201 [Suillus luteus UH-Slu-Lm8-n1]
MTALLSRANFGPYKVQSPHVSPCGLSLYPLSLVPLPAHNKASVSLTQPGFHDYGDVSPR